MNGCGTLDGMKEIVYNDINNEKNNEFKSIKEECAKEVFQKLEKSKWFLSDSQQVLVVLATYSCFIEKRVENLEQKANYSQSLQ